MNMGKTIFECESENSEIDEYFDNLVKSKLKRCSVCRKPLYSYNKSGLCCRHLMDRSQRRKK